jgi:hypothetical protein
MLCYSNIYNNIPKPEIIAVSPVKLLNNTALIERNTKLLYKTELNRKKHTTNYQAIVNFISQATKCVT